MSGLLTSTRIDKAEESSCAPWPVLTLEEDSRASFAILRKLTWSPVGLVVPASTFAFLPDFTEHPKPKKKKPRHVDSGDAAKDDAPLPDDSESDEVVFFHDFIAGGVAGSASVLVGHPFDT